MVGNVSGRANSLVIFLLVMFVPVYFASVHIYRFFSDKPLQPKDEESRRLREARMEEFLRRHPKPTPAPAGSFTAPKEPEPPPKPADPYADLRKLSELQKRSLTKEHLYLIKGALYQYRNEQGRCPEKLEELVPDYLSEMPPALIPGPLGTISSNVYNAPNGAIALNGAGGWSYNADPKHKDYCGVRPNSSHYNSPEGIWSSSH